VKACSFCERPLAEVVKLIEAPAVSICDACVVGATVAVTDHACSFCRKPSFTGMARRGFTICETDIELCREILREAGHVVPRATLKN
jgi:hypothetical protein